MVSLREFVGNILSGSRGSSPSSEPPGLMESVLGMIGGGGGLNGLLDILRQKGLGEAVQSWVGTGQNMPVEGEQVQAALGDEKIEEISQKAGLAPNETAEKLAQLLPQVVDKLTPGGRIPDAGSLMAMLQSLKAGLGKRPD